MGKRNHVAERLLAELGRLEAEIAHRVDVLDALPCPAGAEVERLNRTRELVEIGLAASKALSRGTELVKFFSPAGDADAAGVGPVQSRCRSDLDQSPAKEVSTH